MTVTRMRANKTNGCTCQYSVDHVAIHFSLVSAFLSVGMLQSIIRRAEESDNIHLCSDQPKEMACLRIQQFRCFGCSTA